MGALDRTSRTQLSSVTAMRARNVSTPTPADVEAALRLVEASSRDGRDRRDPRPSRDRRDRSESRRRASKPAPPAPLAAPADHIPTPAELAELAQASANETAGPGSPHASSPGRGGSSPDSSNDVS